MKNFKALAMILFLSVALGACGVPQGELDDTDSSSSVPEGTTENTNITDYADAVVIHLADGGITVDGVPVPTDTASAVYTANDIVYYESGMDFTYGEGEEGDAHSAEDAEAHTVLHITKPGTYSISGSLSCGQIAVDLGKEAKEDPSAVVTLVFNGADITCKVAPAVIFYNVYECGNDDTETASKDVDTSAAGANVIIADGSENTVNGSYVARIYKPDSVVLSEDGTEVEDAKKLHKYDGAFYSKMSMNISGGRDDTGVLNINAENEGMDSEMHLTINGGIINIKSGNDGINTNEDGVSVTAINGGELNITVTGETGEGDGIDSNGWLVINGGTVMASACSDSADAGIDSDMGIHINGGSVTAFGNMLDRIEDGAQNHAVFRFAKTQFGEQAVCLKNEDGATLAEILPVNDYSVMIHSSPDLTEGTYTLWSGGVQLAGYSGGMDEMPGIPGGMPGMKPGGATPPEGDAPSFEGIQQPTGELPPEFPDKPDMPKEGEFPDKPDAPNDGEWKHGNRREPNEDAMMERELSSEFKISNGANMFAGVTRTE